MWYGHGRPYRYNRLLSACTLVSESTACISPLLSPYLVGPQAVHIARGVMKILLLVVCAAAVCNATTDGFRELLKNGKSTGCNYCSSGMGVVWSHPIVADTFASEGESMLIYTMT